MTAHRSRRIFVLALTAAAVALAPAQAIKRHAFITSVSGNGNLASWPGASGATVLDMADSICRARAAAATPNPLPNAGTYRAWISTSTVDAYCHVQGAFGTRATACGGFPLPGGGPWYRIPLSGSLPVTASLDQLVSPPYAIYAPFFLDENGDFVNSGKVLTGTSFTGMAVPGKTCNDWTSSLLWDQQSGGDPFSSGDQWTGDVFSGCAQSMHLLCLEPGVSETTTQGWEPAALAFVTSAVGSGALGSWPEAEGQGSLAAGNRICRHLATAAHLPAPSSFVAWISAFPTEAGDTVTTNGPFRRVDGYSIADDHDDLVFVTVHNSLDVDEHGHYLTEPGATWTGTDWDGTTSGTTCVAWTDGSSAFDGTVGLATTAYNINWTQKGDQQCDTPAHLYCISNQITIFWDGFELTGDASRWSAISP